MSRNYEFVQVDVFTRTRLAGNPLAVFGDSHGLSDEDMQALAREMNPSETTFILPREPEQEDRARFLFARTAKAIESPMFASMVTPRKCCAER